MQRLSIQLLLCLSSVGYFHSANAQNRDTVGKFQDEVSYTNDIRPIVNNFCATCHAGKNPEGEFVLTSYGDVRKHVEAGELIKRINDADDPMPQSGLMPEYMRRLFDVWAEQGFIDEGTGPVRKDREQMQKFTPRRIVPIDIRGRQGYELLAYLQGHWVGSMDLMGVEYEWMAFDYRPISPSHIHGMFEGGSIGNLFTSFFIAELHGKQTIVARNGGLLNGIYRTSYFVLDRVQFTREEAFYRLVDAYGGSDIMWMELRFRGNSLEFNAYTSRFGLTEPRKHMSFQGKRMHADLAISAAKAVGFPKRVVDYKFPADGLPKPTWAGEYPQTSASYLCEETGKSLIELGKLARDPRRVDQMPYLSRLTVTVNRSPKTEAKKLLVYLSRDALADERGKFIGRDGYIRVPLLDTLLLFPELNADESEFTFTYLHPGEYYLTVIADMNGDGYQSPGDLTHPQRKVTVKPEEHPRVTIRDLKIQN